MSSGYQHNRNRNRDSPSTPVSSSNRPRSNSKNSSDSNQKNRNATVNGKMPSVANSPTSDHITDGMASLALENVRYPIGSRVTTKLNKGGPAMKGEVLGYDPNFKVVILKSSGSRPGRNNVSLVNLAHCSEMKVEEEGKEAPGELQSLNTQRLEQRFKDSIEKKKKLIMAFKAGISPEGQRLFQVINKTLDDVMWNGDKIVVMGVTIEPPYRPESIKSSADNNKAKDHIRKIVEKHIRDQEAAKPTASSTTSALSVASPSAAAVVAESPVATTSTNSRTTPSVTPSIPNLPQAPAPPSSHSSGNSSGKSSNFRSNRNNGGRNSNRQHHDYHPKPMYNN